jgi:WD40 repeat protein
VGGLAVSGGHDGTVRLWDLRTGEGLGVVGHHEGWVGCVAISPDGRLALTGGEDRTIRIRDMKSGEIRGTIDGLGTGVRALEVSPDGSLVLSSGDDTAAQLWDLSSSVRLLTLEGHESWIGSVAISADGRYVVSGGLDCSVRLWDLRTGACLAEMKGHDDWVRDVAISPDGRFALTGGHDRDLRLWDLRTGECLHILKGHEDWVGCVSFSPDGRYALSGGHDSTLRFWEFDWGYEFPGEVDWAEAAAPYLDSFLALRSPVGADGIVRRGAASWSDEHFLELLQKLSLHGYGWLRAEGVARKLNALSAARAERGSAASTPEVVSGLALELMRQPTGMHCVCCGKRFAARDLNSGGFCAECQGYAYPRQDEGEQASWWKKLTGRQARP